MYRLGVGMYRLGVGTCNLGGETCRLGQPTCKLTDSICFHAHWVKSISLYHVHGCLLYFRKRMVYFPAGLVYFPASLLYFHDLIVYFGCENPPPANTLERSFSTVTNLLVLKASREKFLIINSPSVTV